MTVELPISLHVAVAKGSQGSECLESEGNAYLGLKHCVFWNRKH